MAKQDNIELEGTVVKVNPNSMFEVEVEGGHIVTCTISGKLRINKIKIILGDHVTVEISPYDLTRGRITWRTK